MTLLNNKRLLLIFVSVAFLLLIPFVAMQFNEEVNWSLSDFLVAGILLLGTGFTCEFVIRKVTNKKKRILICGVVLVALILIWIELAVGILGSTFAGS